MAHPNKKEGVVGHNEKLRKMTEHYGAADKSMYKVAKGNLENGPQKDYGYGAMGEGEASPARGDRTRRSTPANPIAAYKRGGRIASDRMKAEERCGGGRMRADGGAVLSSSAPENQEPAQNRAWGGRVGKKTGKPATHINIVVAPGNSAAQPAPVLPVGGPPGVAMPPRPMPASAPAPVGAMPPGPMGAGPLPGGGPMMPPPPGAIPPGAMPPRKRGGRIDQNSKAHPDAAEDAKEIRAMVKPSALRARGGRMTAGAESGPGRLEKTAMRARRQAGDKSAEA